MTKSITPKSIVFYADDDVDDLQLVQEAFRHYARNVDIITATNGSEALSYFNNLSEEDPLPCLIILDINMPLVSGKQVLVNLRSQERFAEIPIVLFSTSSMPSDKHFAKQYEAGFITKPLDMHQMEIIADQFIEHCSEEVRKKIRRHLQ